MYPASPTPVPAAAPTPAPMTAPASALFHHFDPVHAEVESKSTIALHLNRNPTPLLSISSPNLPSSQSDPSFFSATPLAEKPFMGKGES